MKQRSKERRLQMAIVLVLLQQQLNVARINNLAQGEVDEDLGEEAHPSPPWSITQFAPTRFPSAPLTSMSPSSFFMRLYCGSALFMLSYLSLHSSSLTTPVAPSLAVSFSS